MDWDNLFNSMNNAVERKVNHLEKTARSKARTLSDGQLLAKYNSGDLNSIAQEAVEYELSRRGLL